MDEGRAKGIHVGFRIMCCMNMDGLPLRRRLVMRSNDLVKM